jgi:hypothetical protein
VGPAGPGGLASSCFDVIVGADLTYDPAGHAPLLDTVRQLAAPHTQVGGGKEQIGMSPERISRGGEVHVSCDG